MSIKLTDTQLVLLSAASQRDDHCLVPATGARLSPARKAAAKLLNAGLVKEVRARKDMPVWRRDEDADQAFALKLTAAALKAIAAEANEDSGDAPTATTARRRGASFKSLKPRSPNTFRMPPLTLCHPNPSFLGLGQRSARSSRRWKLARRSTRSSPRPGGCRTRRGLR